MPAGTRLAINLLLTADVSRAEKLIDQFTSKAGKRFAKMNLEATHRIQSGFAKFELGRQLIRPLEGMLTAAVAFEDKMADVAKVTNTDIGTKEFKLLEDSARSVSAHINRSAIEAGELMANLAAGGVAEENLERVAKQAGEIAVAFDVSAGEAGDAYMMIMNAMNLSEKQVSSTMDAMNALTNKFGGKASQLLDFMASGAAGVANTLKVSGENMQAFGNSFLVVGKNSAEAATIMERFQKAIFANSELSKIFTDADGGTAGLVAVLEAAKKSGSAYQWLAQRNLGAYASPLAQLAGNMDSERGLKNQLALLQDPANIEGSAHDEFLNRQKTTLEQFNRMKNTALNLGASLGETLIPALSDLLTKVNPLIERFAEWTKENPKLISGAVQIAAAAGVASMAVGALQIAFGGAGRLLSQTALFFIKNKDGISGLSKVLDSNLVTALKSVTSATLKMTMAALSNPYIVGAVAIAGAAYLIIKNWDKISAWFMKLWDKVKKIFSTAFKIIAALVINFTPAGLIYKHWDTISKWFKDIWDDVKIIFSAAWESIKELFLNYTPLGLVISHWDGIVDAFKDIWERVKDVFNAAGEAIKNSWIGRFASKLIGGVSGAVSSAKDLVSYASDHGLADVVARTGRNPATGFAPLAMPGLPQPVPLAASSNDRFSFAPIFNISGSVDQQTANAITAQLRRDFELRLKDYEYNKRRRAF